MHIRLVFISVSGLYDICVKTCITGRSLQGPLPIGDLLGTIRSLREKSVIKPELWRKARASALSLTDAMSDPGVAAELLWEACQTPSQMHLGSDHLDMDPGLTQGKEIVFQINVSAVSRYIDIYLLILQPVLILQAILSHRILTG